MFLSVFKTAAVLICKEMKRAKRRSLVDFVAASQPTEDENISYKRLIPIKDLQVKDSEEDDGKLCFICFLSLSEHFLVW